MTSPQGDKGNKFERETVALLRERGFTRAARTLAGERLDRGDVSGVDNCIIQCKNVKRLDLSGWLDQAEQQAANAGVTRYAVIHKRRGKTDAAESYTTIPTWLFIELLNES